MLRDRTRLLRMIQDLHESPDAKETAILEENRLALSDPAMKEFLRIHHMLADRRSSLEDFMESCLSQRVVAIVERYCDGSKDLAICEIQTS